VVVVRWSSGAGERGRLDAASSDHHGRDHRSHWVSPLPLNPLR
jgi:hypothetical protein